MCSTTELGVIAPLGDRPDPSPSSNIKALDDRHRQPSLPGCVPWVRVFTVPISLLLVCNPCMCVCGNSKAIARPTPITGTGQISMMMFQAGGWGYDGPTLYANRQEAAAAAAKKIRR